MLENYSLNYDIFVRKLDVIEYLKKDYGMNYADIAYIVQSSPEIVRTYCIILLRLN